MRADEVIYPREDLKKITEAVDYYSRDTRLNLKDIKIDKNNLLHFNFNCIDETVGNWDVEFVANKAILDEMDLFYEMQTNAFARASYLSHFEKDNIHSEIFERKWKILHEFSNKFGELFKNERDKYFEENNFNYGCYTFKPIGTIPKRMRYSEMYNYLKVNTDLDFSTCHYDYDYNRFYEKCLRNGCDDSADIFECINNGKKYIPCTNELFEWKGPYDKLETKEEFVND